MKWGWLVAALGLALSTASHGQQNNVASDPTGSESCQLTIMRQASEQGGPLADDEVRYINVYFQSRGANQLLQAMAIDPTMTIVKVVSHSCKQGMTLRQALDALGSAK